MVGVYWPEVQIEFDQSVGALGWVSFVYGIARMSTAVAGRLVLRRTSMGHAFVATLLCLAAGTVVLASAASWPIFLLSIAVVGATSGLIDSLGAIFITTISDVASAGLIHGMYGFGATAGPLIVVAAPGWRWSAVAAAAIVIGAVAIAWTARTSWPPPVQANDDQPDVGSDDTSVGSSRETAANPVIVWASLGAFAALVALEVTTGQWAFTYLTERRDLGESLAALGVSSFWGGLMTGRLLMSRNSVSRVIDELGTVKLSLVALASITSVAVLPPVGTVIALGISGLALGPLIPTLFARTRDRVGDAQAGRMAGRQLLATNVGAITVPALTGVMVDVADARVIIIVMIIVLGGISLPLLATLRRIAPV